MHKFWKYHFLKLSEPQICYDFFLCDSELIHTKTFHRPDPLITLCAGYRNSIFWSHWNFWLSLLWLNSSKSFLMKEKTHFFVSHHKNLRSSRLEVYCKKDVLRNFAKFTGKHLCQSLFFNKVADQEILAQVFSCEFCEICQNIFFYRTPPDNCFWNVL